MTPLELLTIESGSDAWLFMFQMRNPDTHIQVQVDPVSWRKILTYSLPDGTSRRVMLVPGKPKELQ